MLPGILPQTLRGLDNAGDFRPPDRMCQPYLLTLDYATDCFTDQLVWSYHRLHYIDCPNEEPLEDF